MKHAGAVSLKPLLALLDGIRGLPGLVERQPGIFYRKGTAYLHFHEDAQGLFADLKRHGGGFERLPVNTPAERASLLALIRKGRAERALSSAAPSPA